MIPVRSAAVTLLACALLACTSKPAAPAKQYELRGVVVQVNAARRELRVKHQDIPGHMRAMTMNFPVRDDAALKRLAAGDEITAQLNVASSGDSWLSDIKIGPAPPKPSQ